jgi:hypothetical protein
MSSTFGRRNTALIALVAGRLPGGRRGVAHGRAVSEAGPEGVGLRGLRSVRTRNVRRALIDRERFDEALELLKNAQTIVRIDASGDALKP